MRPHLFLFLFIFIFISPATRAEDPPAPFEIKEGDRVLFLGDVLLEREGTYGYLETRMQEQFPNRHFTVRNLSFSGDTPLGWSRASFDPPAAGFDRLKEQLALVKPTVVFLGYGMAASLQEMTDRSGDITLNPDTVRYGAEPYSAARFKKEMGQLMDAIVAAAADDKVTGRQGDKVTPPASPDPKVTPSPDHPVTPSSSPVRFVLLSPIRHEDLRKTKPGLPDPAEHNKLLAQYSKAIKELAKERGAQFVDYHTFELGGSPELPEMMPPLTENGIHLNEMGYATVFRNFVAYALSWTPATKPDLNRDPGGVFSGFADWLDIYTPNFVSSAAVDALAKGHPEAYEREYAAFEALRAAIVKKNELFFHRWRPENQTYLFGFRKHEQGQNAKEIPEFDPLIAAAEAEIDKLKRAPKEAGAAAPATPATAQVSQPAPADIAPLPLPQFDLDPALEITLWAETPLLAKPTEMNWDAAGRLWVTSSGLYPMIAPGGEATDKVLVLEDPEHVGHATKSTVFAEGLLVPTGVEADFGSKAEGQGLKAKGESPAATPQPSALSPQPFPAACYVGASTELLRFEDTDGDGKADQRRIVLSGFGTEDTHHILHTLRWGPDGRLYFDQSIYIHSHLETPWGMVRMNSGAVMAYDPRTERVEVCYKGFCNPWGHAWDKWGQEFITDGAGGQGLSWGILGAMYFTYENGKNLLPSISPGSYPKFASLELIQSPHFPADWQGDAITCDFRAHRIVRFHINDLAESKDEGRGTKAGDAAAPEKPSTLDPRPSTAKSGYITTEMPDIVRTADVSFRPIDVKLGPDGALYVADWSNPVINHGEVDFRDPRRDHTHGRIWRISVKGSAPLKWEAMTGKKTEELFEKVLSGNLWEKQQARRVLAPRLVSGKLDEKADGKLVPEAGNPSLALVEWAKSDASKLEALWIQSAVRDRDEARVHTDLLKSKSSEFRATGVRLLSRLEAHTGMPDLANGWVALPWLEGASLDPVPRVRVEAMRALSRIQAPQSAALVLTAALNAPKDDPYYAYAAVLSINDLAKPWTDAIASGKWTPDSPEKQKQLAWGLANIRADLASATLAKLVADNKVPLDGSGPWIELIGQAGGPKELQRLYLGLLAATIPEGDNMPAMAPQEFTLPGWVLPRAARALGEAARLRGVQPENPYRDGRLPYYKKSAETPEPPLALWQFFAYAPSDCHADVVRLLGLWKADDAAKAVAMTINAANPPEVVAASFESLRMIGSNNAVALVESYTDSKAPAIRRRAVLTLAALRPTLALPLVTALVNEPMSDDEMLGLWRELVKEKAFTDLLAPNLLAILPKPAAAAALRAAREAGKNGEKLAAALAPMPSVAAAPRDMKADIKHFAEAAVTNGHPIEGEAIYHRIGCVVCHSIGGAGGKFGPDFTSLGASAPLDYIVESVLDPAAKVKEGFIAFSFTMKDGSQAVGIPTRETATEQFIRPGPGPEIALVKANIVKRDSVGSLMPAGLIEPLKEDEKLSLIAFLSQVGKPGPFDASKSTVARVWWLFPSSVLASAVTPGGDAPAVIANVDGALPKQRLADALPLLANAGDGPKAVTKFQLATAGRVKLNLTGIREAWLDGQGLAVASEPSPTVDLPAGVHTFAVRLDPKALPDTLRVESAEVRFLTE